MLHSGDFVVESKDESGRTHQVVFILHCAALVANAQALQHATCQYFCTFVIKPKEVDTDAVSVIMYTLIRLLMNMPKINTNLPKH